MDLQSLSMYAAITVLMAPLLVVYGLPFIAGARGFSYFAQLWLGERSRFVIASAIAALGIAPSYDVYKSPVPIYARLLDGAEVSGPFMLASFFVTWIVVMALAHQTDRVLARRNP
jgi:hypothetical protein